MMEGIGAEERQQFLLTLQKMLNNIRHNEF